MAFAYGLLPNALLPKIFDFTVTTPGLANICRAIMGLYLAMAALWVAGIFKPALWHTATIANIIFMGGLATGRLIGFIADGIPAVYLWVGCLVELLLAVWGVRNLRKYGWVN